MLDLRNIKTRGRVRNGRNLRCRSWRRRRFWNRRVLHKESWAALWSRYENSPRVLKLVRMDSEYQYWKHYANTAFQNERGSRHPKKRILTILRKFHWESIDLISGILLRINRDLIHPSTQRRSSIQSRRKRTWEWILALKKLRNKLLFSSKRLPFSQSHHSVLLKASLSSFIAYQRERRKWW